MHQVLHKHFLGPEGIGFFFLVVYYEPLIYCALILLILFQQIIGRRHIVDPRAVRRFQDENMKASF